MRESLKSNRYRPRLRSKQNEHRDNKQSKAIKTKCSSAIKIIQLISAILVPIMIGAFTVVTTLQESKNAQLQRDADVAKIQRQAQLQQEAEIRQRDVDALKIKEQQQRDDIIAQEIRIQNVYDTFMREISSIVIKDNINLTIPEIIFARSKTLLALEQIDAKRKWYLIKFLYDSDLLYTNKNKLGMRFIDLAGVDLSNVKFGTAKKFSRRLNLHGIRLPRLQLINSSFENVGLNQADFEFSDLNNSNFISVSMNGAYFRETILENSKFVLLHLQNSSFQKAKLKLSSWSSISPTDLLAINNIDYSTCDLSESIFQHMTITANVRFDQATLERITFIDMKFSSGTIFNNLNMKMSKFSGVRLIDGKFIRCNLIGAIFEQCHFKNVIFENVDLQQSQFDDMSDSGNIQFSHVNLIGSNLNVTNSKISRLADSFLPNGTFKTSFMPFGMNLIKNGDAEQGRCYSSYQNSINTVIQGWSRHGDVAQIFYKNNGLQMNMTNYIDDWHSCFFFGGYQSLNLSNSNEHTIRQEINVEQLSILINSRQAKYNASAYLGGFEDEQSSTLMKIGFKNTKNKIEYAVVGPVTNINRQNQTAMLFSSFSGTIPNDTILISIELIFHRQKSHHGLRFGMADNLNFFIRQK